LEPDFPIVEALFDAIICFKIQGLAWFVQPGAKVSKSDPSHPRGVSVLLPSTAKNMTKKRVATNVGELVDK
jgi:hypothetical protein